MMRMGRRHVLLGGLMGACAALVGALAWASPAAASGSIQVTTTADEYDFPTANATCSLREAITAISNTASFGGCAYSSGADTILLSSGSVYSLTRISTDESYNVNGDLDIRQSMTITVANGGRADVAINNVEDRVLELPVSGVTVTIANLTLRNGIAPPSSAGGGVLLNKGTLFLDWVTIRNGSASQAGYGGGIFNFGGVMTVTNSIVDSNLVDGSAPGGGIANFNGAKLTLVNTSVLDNQAISFGGGIYNDGSVLVIRNSTINGNTADEAEGGGIYMFSGSATLNNVTISDNVSGAGVITGTGRSGGGIYHQSGLFFFSNSLITGNNAAPGREDCYTEIGQSIRSSGYNLLGIWTDADCSIMLEPGTPVVISNTVPPVTLGAIGYYASSLPTRALTSSSTPALDGGNPGGSGVECEATDQRGWLRSLAAPCDIGAFELVDLQTVYLPLILR